MRLSVGSAIQPPRRAQQPSPESTVVGEQLVGEPSVARVPQRARGLVRERRDDEVEAHAQPARVVAAVRAALDGGGDATAAARAVLEAARPRPPPPTAPANGLQQLRDMMNQPRPPTMAPPPPQCAPMAPPRPPQRTAGPDNGLQQLRDLLARSDDDDDSVPETPGTTI